MLNSIDAMAPPRAAHPDSRAAGGRAVLSSLSRGIELVEGWLQRARERRELARLGDRDLRDFGASFGDRVAELRKPFWRG